MPTANYIQHLRVVLGLALLLAAAGLPYFFHLKTPFNALVLLLSVIASAVFPGLFCDMGDPNPSIFLVSFFSLSIADPIMCFKLIFSDHSLGDFFTSLPFIAKIAAPCFVPFYLVALEMLFYRMLVSEEKDLGKYEEIHTIFKTITSTLKSTMKSTMGRMSDILRIIADLGQPGGGEDVNETSNPPPYLETITNAEANRDKFNMLV